MCNATDYTVDWWNFPPFVSLNNETNTSGLHGIMIDAIKDASAACCYKFSLNFSVLTSTRRFSSQEVMLSNLTHNNILALPVIIPSSVSASKPSEYFIRMIDTTGMIHIAKHGNPVRQVLMGAFFSVWPLVVALIVLTGYSAIILWLMQCKSSRDSDKALQSLFDWYWFSFITAATVGYGDKLPKGVLPKTFTMIWAIFGISVMVGTTASLTTLLTQHQQTISRLEPIKGAKVGVLLGSIERRFVMQKGGIPVEYATQKMLVNALYDGTIDHLALDHFSFHRQPRSLPPHFKYEVVETPETTIGYIFYAPSQSELIECLRLQSFLAALRVDSKIIKELGHKVTEEPNARQYLQDAADAIFSRNMKMTLLLMALICLALTAAIVACSVLIKCCKRRANPANNTSKTGRITTNDADVKLTISGPDNNEA